MVVPSLGCQPCGYRVWQRFPAQPVYARYLSGAYKAYLVRIWLLPHDRQLVADTGVMPRLTIAMARG
ncbi:MAG: hypothetical protein ORN52_11380 [Beijerinckiaceae bacterium]|jgi:hypothetical protein|nr:hypothetical protein [Beijerinckiaceae bacterium]